MGKMNVTGHIYEGGVYLLLFIVLPHIRSRQRFFRASTVYSSIDKEKLWYIMNISCTLLFSTINKEQNKMLLNTFIFLFNNKVHFLITSPREQKDLQSLFALQSHTFVIWVTLKNVWWHIRIFKFIAQEPQKLKKIKFILFEKSLNCFTIYSFCHSHFIKQINNVFNYQNKLNCYYFIIQIAMVLFIRISSPGELTKCNA